MSLENASLAKRFLTESGDQLSLAHPGLQELVYKTGKMVVLLVDAKLLLEPTMIKANENFATEGESVRAIDAAVEILQETIDAKNEHTDAMLKSVAAAAELANSIADTSMAIVKELEEVSSFINDYAETAESIWDNSGQTEMMLEEARNANAAAIEALESYITQRS